MAGNPATTRANDPRKRKRSDPKSRPCRNESVRLDASLCCLRPSDGRAGSTHPRSLRIHLASASSRSDACGSANTRRAESSMSFGTTGPKRGVKGASSRSVAHGSSSKTTGKRGDSGWLFGLRRQKSWVRIPPRPLRFQRVSGWMTTHRRRDWSQARSQIIGKSLVETRRKHCPGGRRPRGIFSSLDASRCCVREHSGVTVEHLRRR